MCGEATAEKKAELIAGATESLPANLLPEGSMSANSPWHVTARAMASQEIRLDEGKSYTGVFLLVNVQDTSTTALFYVFFSIIFPYSLH